MSPRPIASLRLVGRTSDPIVDALRSIERVRANIELADAIPDGDSEIAITEPREIARVSLAG